MVRGLKKALQGKTLEFFFFFRGDRSEISFVKVLSIYKRWLERKDKAVVFPTGDETICGFKLQQTLIKLVESTLKNRSTGIDQKGCQIPSSTCLKNEDACLQVVYIQKFGEVLIKTACSPLWYYFVIPVISSWSWNEFQLQHSDPLASSHRMRQPRVTGSLLAISGCGDKDL